MENLSTDRLTEIHIRSLHFSASVYELQDHKYLARGYPKFFGLLAKFLIAANLARS